MSKTKKIISLVLVAMMIMAMATVAIVSTSALAEGETYIVAGSGALCGSEWNPADTNNQMTWNAEKSVYEKVYTNVAAGTYNYKVVRGTTWGDAYTELGPANSMGDDGVINVTEDGSTVTLAFNGGNVVITVSAAPVETTTAAPVAGNGVTVGGTTYDVAVGDTITYTYTLTTPTNVENAQATTYYDPAKLELIPGKAKDMFPVLRDVTSVVFNTDIAGQVKFNATEGVEEGYDFTEGGVLVTLQFKVLDASASEIYTVLEEMVKFGEKVDYATGGEIVNDAVKAEEVLEGGVVTTTPAETETTPAETETTVITAPAGNKGIIVGGVTYPVTVGDIVTYTYELTTPANVENAQATTYFDADKLELIETKAKEMFPVLRDVTSVVYNTEIAGQVKFNATEGVEEGYDFTEGGVLVTLQFKVLDDAESTIYTTLEEMVKFGEKVDYATGGQIVNDGVSYVETLTGNTPPPVTSEVTTAPTETSEATTATETDPTETSEATTATETDPTETSEATTATETAPTETSEATTATETDPTETTVETKPVETKPVETKPVETKPVETKPVETKPVETKPVETTAAPATGLTSATEAGTTAAGTDAPNTGAAAYIYVVMAVLAMAACAVVVLRKRVNG